MLSPDTKKATLLGRFDFCLVLSGIVRERNEINVRFTAFYHLPMSREGVTSEWIQSNKFTMGAHNFISPHIY
ncbi:hypothetical protein D0812_22015 [Vibrio owensii]|uniref:Uncharacterized protein n=1 Tax=Vibrio owensii TaxID=696485 RepID=A0ABM6ZND9_9VIBR|nr:hypothetical protein D0812_22015 [Vibrio owensii]